MSDQELIDTIAATLSTHLTDCFACRLNPVSAAATIHTAVAVRSAIREGHTILPKPPVHNCAGCEMPLERVFDEVGTQYRGALEVNFCGGYGMFFDNIDGDRQVFLCRDCAETACKAMPWMGRLFGRGNDD